MGGAAGYVLKQASNEQIAGAIRGALGGEVTLNQELAMRVLRRLLEEAQPNVEEQQREEEGAAAVPASSPGTGRRPAHGSSPGPTLLDAFTAREAEVLRLLASGNNNQEIADGLFISLSTAKKHVRRVIAKLGVSYRTQATIRAIELGLFSDRPGQASPGLSRSFAAPGEREALGPASPGSIRRSQNRPGIGKPSGPRHAPSGVTSTPKRPATAPASRVPLQLLEYCSSFSENFSS